MRISDWSSDVCSSDLARAQIWRPARSAGAASLSDADQFLRVEPSEARSDGRRRAGKAARRRLVDSQQEEDRKSVVSGRRVSVRVDLGGRRVINKKKRYHAYSVSTA